MDYRIWYYSAIAAELHLEAEHESFEKRLDFLQFIHDRIDPEDKLVFLCFRYLPLQTEMDFPAELMISDRQDVVLNFFKELTLSTRYFIYEFRGYEDAIEFLKLFAFDLPGYKSLEEK